MGFFQLQIVLGNWKEFETDNQILQIISNKKFFNFICFLMPSSHLSDSEEDFRGKHKARTYSRHQRQIKHLHKLRCKNFLFSGDFCVNSIRKTFVKVVCVWIMILKYILGSIKSCLYISLPPLFSHWRNLFRKLNKYDKIFCVTQII